MPAKICHSRGSRTVGAAECSSWAMPCRRTVSYMGDRRALYRRHMAGRCREASEARTAVGHRYEGVYRGSDGCISVSKVHNMNDTRMRLLSSFTDNVER